VEKARQEAVRLLGEKAAGRDPAEARDEAKRDPSVAELCDLYLAEGCAIKKPSTITTDKSRIERHIKPISRYSTGYNPQRIYVPLRETN
jgi:hypothetical protein